MTMQQAEGTRTYSSTEVLEMIPGLTYRVMDYLLRTGAIRLEGEECPGSGQRRTWREDEVFALRRLVERYSKAREELAAIRSGRTWSEECRVVWRGELVEA